MDQRQQQNNDARKQDSEELFDDSDRHNLHRMKRHPELQPYVPSDRFPACQQPAFSNSRPHINTKPRTTTTSPMTTTKKYCSMTRLNQLAKPKMRPASTVTLSTNSSSRSVNSVNRTSEKQREIRSKAKEPQLQQQQQQQQPRPIRRDEKLTSATKPPQPKKPAEPSSLRANRKPQEMQQRQTPKQPTQQSQRKLSDRPPITPITSVKPSTMITPLSPKFPKTNTQTPQSSTPVNRDGKTTTPAVRQLTTPAIQLPTPASSLEEELESATKPNRNDITRDIVVEERNIVEQVSEMSVNDPFYQSAASDLVPDSETSTNGINYDRNAESLCREFEQDLIAKGMVKEIDPDDFRSPMFNGQDDSLRRTSAATIVTTDNLAQQEQSPQVYDEDDRRLKIEKELRDKAKKEDDDRKEREQLVESILSRFSQGSVS